MHLAERKQLQRSRNHSKDWHLTLVAVIPKVKKSNPGVAPNAIKHFMYKDVAESVTVARVSPFLSLVLLLMFFGL